MDYHPITVEGVEANTGKWARVFTEPYSPCGQDGKLIVPWAVKRRYFPWLVTLSSNDGSGVVQVVSLFGEAGAIEIAKAHCGPGAELYRYYFGSSFRYDLPDDYVALS